MPRQLHIVAAGICLTFVVVVTGAWLGASTMAAPPPQPPVYPDEVPDPIADGSGDIERFFRACGFTKPFKLMTAVRDETLGRRYYRIRVGVDAVGTLQQRLGQAWIWGHFNRAVYQDNHSSRLPHSRNLPTWWKPGGNPGDTTLMLEHAGKPKWYAVLNNDGEVDLMWVAR
jgi:hypothetical protein